MILIINLFIGYNLQANIDDTMLWFKCNTHKDLLKLGEKALERGKELNEFMFLIPINTRVNNFLDDSIGYFIHNKNEKLSGFIMILWMENEKKCLYFDGSAGKVKGHDFFKQRNALLDALKKSKQGN